jgi:uncharacterized protein (UPF0248 family)
MIVNWSLKICHWQLKTNSPTARLPMINSQFSIRNSEAREFKDQIRRRVTPKNLKRAARRDHASIFGGFSGTRVPPHRVFNISRTCEGSFVGGWQAAPVQR